MTSLAPPAPTDDILGGAIQGQEAVFLGWQKSASGDIFPLYTVLKTSHPSFQSTVTDKTLRRMHLHIPRTPSPYPGVALSPWHNMGSELANPATATEAIESAGLDYTVVKKPLKEVVGLDQPADVSDRWATVRTDTGDVLGIVGDSYQPIQNRDAFRFFDTLVGADEAIYETAGVIGRGERIWILVKLPGFITVHGNDIVGKYLLLSNSHDGIVCLVDGGDGGLFLLPLLDQQIALGRQAIRAVLAGERRLALHGLQQAIQRGTRTIGDAHHRVAVRLPLLSRGVHIGLDLGLVALHGGVGARYRRDGWTLVDL